jgi:hypothetical protein
MPVEIRIDEAELRELLYGPAGPVVREVRRVTNRTLNTAKRYAPVDEGTLRASLQGTVEVSGPLVIGRVGSHLEYALFLHFGTGIYGPRGRPITPVSSKVLVFEPGRMTGPLPAGRRHPPRGRRGKVFAVQVRGTPRNLFLVNALRDAAAPWPVTEASGP